jgi:hypothetical protein
MSNTHRLQVLIPPSLHARITKAAQRARISRGEWVRRVVKNALLDLDREVPAAGGRRIKVIRSALDELASLNAPTADIEQMIEESTAGKGDLPE